MAVTHNTALRNILADAVASQMVSGSLVLLSAADATLVTLTLDGTPFGASSNGTITAADTPLTATASAGTATAATKAQLKSSDGLKIVNCSVSATGGGGDIQLSSTAITSGQTVTISSLTYSAPA